MRPVLDTNVLVAGLRSRSGASHAVLRLVAAGMVRPLVTIGLFLEYESVLKRPEQVLAYGFSIAEVDRFLSEFAALSEPVDVHFLWRPQLADPRDELVLEAAANGRADAIVTFNLRDFVPAAAFGIRVLSPQSLLTELPR